jgi:hypothetical protein
MPEFIAFYNIASISSFINISPKMLLVDLLYCLEVRTVAV